MYKQGNKKVGGIKKAYDSVAYDSTVQEYYIQAFPHSFKNMWKIREGKYTPVWGKLFFGKKRRA